MRTLGILVACINFAILGAGAGFWLGREKGRAEWKDSIVFDQITREQWVELGWGTDPEEKPHSSGDFWCKSHLDGNGEHCQSSYRPENE